MSPNKPLMIARVARAAAASAVFATFAAAHAEMLEPARFVAPSLTLTLTAAPAARPAVAAVPRPVTPAALPQASAPDAVPPATCSAPTEFTHLDRPLIRTARRLAGGEPLTIVAIGSSSTAGAGASAPDASYPSRLAVELKQHFPLQDITVLNRGVNGEEVADMLRRFDTAVIAAKPDLVIWQLGTNSVLRDHHLDDHGASIRAGLAKIRSVGAYCGSIRTMSAPTERILAKPARIDAPWSSR